MTTTSTPQRYRRKPVFVKAIQFTGGGENAADVNVWATSLGGDTEWRPATKGTLSGAMPPRSERLTVTKDGQLVQLLVGDYLVLSEVNKFVRSEEPAFVGSWELDESVDKAQTTVEDRVVDGTGEPDPGPPDGQTLEDPETGELFEVSPGDFDAPDDPETGAEE